MESGKRQVEKPGGVLKSKSYLFALQIVKMCRRLQDERKEFVLSKQMLSSGTAIGALVEEGGQAESRPDFIHKLSIANKQLSMSLLSTINFPLSACHAAVSL